MEAKFKKGDKVWNDMQDRLATVVAYHEKNDLYELDNGFMADEVDLVPLDKEKVKNLFLNELERLLSKYKAIIDVDYKDCVYIEVLGECLYYSVDEGINADTVFDYDKD